ncbi:MAG: hypothetical protein LUD27_02320 [Clostridia bacterium]|nr:hypothetical protein [Clostridia bacterium]
MKLSYEICIDLINNYILTRLPTTDFIESKKRFQERSYIRWALFRIIEMLYKEYYDGCAKLDVYDVIDIFINDMEICLNEKYNWIFDVGKHTAIQIKTYLKNTKLI